MAALGESPLSSNSELGKTLLNLISVFASNFKNIVDGNDITGRPREEGLGLGGSSTTEIYGGARIAYIFNETFVHKSIQQMNPFEGLEDVDIRTAIANANGARGPSLFVPEQAFEWLVRKQIERLREPGLQCIDYVFEEIQRMAYHADCSEISRFPHLRDRIYEVVNRLLRGCMVPTQAMISNLIDIELGYINTSHPDFCGGRNAVNHINKKFNSNSTATAATAPGAGGGAVAAVGSGVSTGAVVPVVGASPAAPPTAQPLPSQPTAVNNINNANPAAAPPPAPAPAAANGYLSQAPDVLGNIPGGGFFGLWKQANGPTSSGPGTGSSTITSSVNPAPSTAVTGHANGQHASSYNKPAAYPTSSSSQAPGPGGGVVKLPPVPERMKSSAQASDKEKVETELIKTLVASYFDIVRVCVSEVACVCVLLYHV